MGMFEIILENIGECKKNCVFWMLLFISRDGWNKFCLHIRKLRQREHWSARWQGLVGAGSMRAGENFKLS